MISVLSGADKACLVAMEPFRYHCPPMATPIKTRFAPSPTGRLHLGNVRTALFNWLFARQQGGVFLLRFEDTDLERSAQAFEAGMQEDLHWLGLDWDEGPGHEGGLGPYRQSQRGDIYAGYFEQLTQNAKAYQCFCTQQELALSRKAQLAAGRPPRYAGTCAHLSAEEVQAKRDQGLAASLRFRVPPNRTVEFVDLVRGPQRFRADDIGDFIVRRSDGTPAFFFSNAVDDALMQITHVLRGEDHLTNTPRQILLLEALELPIPEYGHTSMLVGDDGSPLSKRTGSRSVEELRSQGFIPGAVLNYLARLGHHFEQEGWLPRPELAARFSTQRLGRAPAQFEQSQLLHWQKLAVLMADDDTLWQWVVDFRDVAGRNVEDYVPAAHQEAFLRTVRDNIELPADALRWAQQLFGPTLSLSPEARSAVTEAGADFFRVALDCLAADGEDFKAFVKALGKAAGVKGKALFMPLRAAISGEIHGPELVSVWQLLGNDRVRARLHGAAQLCS